MLPPRLARSIPLHQKRSFFFLPHCHRRPKRSPGLIFLLRTAPPEQWGRRWEYIVKNGVVKEINSEFIPGKGWVSTSAKEKKEKDENFDIDLITLRRIPKTLQSQKGPKAEPLNEASKDLQQAKPGKTKNTPAPDPAKAASQAPAAPKPEKESKAPSKASPPPKPDPKKTPPKGSKTSDTVVQSEAGSKGSIVDPDPLPLQESQIVAAGEKTQVTPPPPLSPPVKPAATGAPAAPKSRTAAKSTEVPVAIPPVEEKLQYHKLNMANRPADTDPDSPDADIDLLVPSDIRAAAGAPGKKVESEEVKKKRRKVMMEEFESVKVEEVPGGAEVVRKAAGKGKASKSAEGGGTKARDLGTPAKELQGKEHAVEGADKAVEAETAKAPAIEAGKLPAELKEKEDYTWSGTEDVSAEDVLQPQKLTSNPTKPLPMVSPQQIFPTSLPPSTQPPPTTTTKLPPKPPSPQIHYILVRNPDSGHMHFSTLPSTLITPALQRENTAFDALQNLGSPGSFLPLWRVLREGGFTVVGGGRDCLVVCVDAQGEKMKTGQVVREIRRLLAEGRGLEVRNDVGVEAVEKREVEKVKAEVMKAKVKVEEVKAEMKAEEVKAEVTVEKVKAEIPIERQVLEKQIEVETKGKVKTRPLRRVFWSAIWVAACSGAVSVGLENYL